MERLQRKSIKDRVNLTIRAATISGLLFNHPAPTEASQRHSLVYHDTPRVILVDPYKPDPVFEEAEDESEEVMAFDDTKEGLVEKETKEAVKSEESIDGCVPTQSFWIGRASYYTINGCIGCNAHRIMANGERLNDSRRTLAFMKTALNTRVLVENRNTGLRTVATVTDRGGFESRGWIADLSLATRNAIGGSDLTPVRITLCI